MKVEDFEKEVISSGLTYISERVQINDSEC